MAEHQERAPAQKSNPDVQQSVNDHADSAGSVQFNDNRPSSLSQLQAEANDSPQANKTAQLQAMANQFTSQQFQPIQKKKNNTGLPDNLKSGIENLSGHSMDDVKVHYNSDKPAQLNAHAYAQGTNIHLGSGQEKHLPHEAWHVVQQKQGRVKPTMQMKGEVNINDDAGLEKEADIKGEEALRAGGTKSDTVSRKARDNTPRLIGSFDGSGVIQNLKIEASKTKALIRHRENQIFFAELVNKGVSLKIDKPHAKHPDLLFKNTCELIKDQFIAVVILTPTADALNRVQGGKYPFFDSKVEFPTQGGSYDDTNDRIVFSIDGVAGSASRDTFKVFDPLAYDELTLKSTMVHETQHLMDYHENNETFHEEFPDKTMDYESAVNRFKSEFRAYWIGGQPYLSLSKKLRDRLGFSGAPANNGKKISYKTEEQFFTRNQKTNFKNQRQERIVIHMAQAPVYEYLNKYYVTSPEYRSMVDNMVKPFGGNLINSKRIEGLRDALATLKAVLPVQNDSTNINEKFNVRKAARGLENVDREFMLDKSASAPMWALIDDCTDRTNVDRKKFDNMDYVSLYWLIKGKK